MDEKIPKFQNSIIPALKNYFHATNISIEKLNAARRKE